MEATAEIPKVQFAKVGAKRDKKKGGLPLWLRGGKAGGSFAGAVGSEGAGGGGSFLGSLGVLGGEGGAAGGAGLFMRIFPKLIMASMVASMGIGAYGLKTAFSPQAKRPFPAKPKKIFDSPAPAQKYSGEISSLPGGAQGDQSGLSMVRGSLDDGSADQAKAAAAQAAQAAQPDANAQAAAPAAPATPDAAAIAAAAAAGAGGGAAGAGKNGPFATRFGQLSSGLGGGSPFSSGGMFGGVGNAFSGKLKNFDGQNQAARAAAPSAASARNPATRLAARQLNNAFMGGKSAQAAMSNGTSMEKASYSNSAPFDNNNPAGSGGIIQGPSGSATPQGGAGVTAGSPSSNNSSGGGYSSNGPSMGGPTQNPMTDCVQMLGPDYTNTANGGCIQTTSGTDVTPWGGMVKMAGMLLMLASALLLAATILWAIPHPISAGIINMLATAAAICGGIATMLGVAVMGMGQTMQGALLTTMGGIVTAAAVMVRLAPDGGWVGGSMTTHFEIFAAGMAGLLGSVFGGMSASSSTAASSQ